jgi:hypothetical protein
VLVLLASSLPVGAIFWGTDLVARVLRAPRTAVDTAVQPVDTAALPAPPVEESEAPTTVPEPAQESEPVTARPALVICEQDLVYRPGTAAPPTVEPEVTVEPEQERLDPAAAREVIEQGWRQGLSIRETAAHATRSPSFVGKVYQELETGGQLQIAGAA